MPVPPSIFENVARMVLGLTRTDALAKLSQIAAGSGREAAQAAGKIAAVLKESKAVQTVTHRVLAVARLRR